MSRVISVRRTETGGGEWTYETHSPTTLPDTPQTTRPGQSTETQSSAAHPTSPSAHNYSLISAVQTPAPGWWYPLGSTNNGPSFNGPLTLSTHAEELDGHGVDAAREVEDGALVEVGADVEDVGVGWGGRSVLGRDR